MQVWEQHLFPFSASNRITSPSCSRRCPTSAWRSGLADTVEPEREGGGEGGRNVSEGDGASSNVPFLMCSNARCGRQ